MVRRTDKETESNNEVNKIESHLVEICKPATAVLLLNAAEDEIVLTAITSLDCFIENSKNCLEFLIDDTNLLPSLVPLLRSRVPIQRLCLKILTKFLKFDDKIEYIKSNFVIDTLIDIYSKATDLIFKEYSSFLLSNLLKAVDSFSVQPNIVDILCFDISKTDDVDLKYNNLQILHHIFKNVSVRDLHKYQLHVDTFVLLLNNSEENIQILSSRILKIISNSNSDEILEEIFSYANINYFFKALMISKWSESHNSILEILQKYIRHDPVKLVTIGMKEFLDFLDFSKRSPPHALACLCLIEEFARNAENREVFYDICLEKDLADFLTIDCELTKIKLMEAMWQLSQNSYCATKLYDFTVVSEIIRQLKKNYLPWHPYRETALKVLCEVRKLKSDILSILLKTDTLVLLIEALDHKDDMNKLCFVALLKIFRNLFQQENKCIAVYLKKAFMKLLLLMNEPNEDFLEITTKILKLITEKEVYRKWFFDPSVLNRVLCLLEDNGKNNYAVLDLLYKLTKFPQIAGLFVGNQFRLLKDETTGNRTLIEGIKTNIYTTQTVLKFHETGILGIDDVIRTRFFVHISLNHEYGKNIKGIENCLEDCYFLLVNFCRKSKSPYQSGISGSTDLQRLDEKIDQFETASNEANPMDDYFLKSYLKEIKLKLQKVPNIQMKILTLARFVCARLSGFSTYGEVYKHDYLTHISELKVKYRSNIIPVGHLRIGSMVEKAVLFKTFCDRNNIPCTLFRISNNVVWNEVPLILNENNSHVTLYVVDLVFKVGNLCTRSVWLETLKKYKKL